MILTLVSQPVTDAFTVHVTIFPQRILFTLEGDLREIDFSSKTPEALWKSTCFELFMRDREGEGYSEINCSFEGAVRLYQFDRYREGGIERSSAAIYGRSYHREIDRVEVEIESEYFDFTDREIAVSAITADYYGVRRFWGKGHWGAPDFHRSENFFQITRDALEKSAIVTAKL